METFVRQTPTGRHVAARAILSETTSVDFNDFYHCELPAMIALARSICGDHGLAEDLAQEAMTKAHREWPRIQSYDRPGAWLRRVTINLALSRRRRVVRELALLTRIAAEPRVGSTSPDPDSAVWDLSLIHI